MSGEVMDFTSIPDLGLDGLVIHLDGPCREFDTNSGFAFEVEFISGETREEVGFTDARVANKDHY
jgi:hypothetical protein